MKFNMRYNDKKLNEIKVLLKKNMISQAKIAIDKYREEYPNDNQIKFYDGLLLMKTATIQKEESSKLFDTAFDIFTEVYEEKGIMSDQSLYEMGMIKVYINDFDCAIACFTKLISESSYDQTFAVIELAKCYQKKGKTTKAKEVLKEKLKSSDNKYIILALAELELQTKNKKEARRLVGLIEEEQSDFYRKVLYIKGKLATVEQEYNKAYTYLTQAQGTKKDNVYWLSQLELAKLYEKENRLEEALDVYLRIKSNRDTLIKNIMNHLGRIYEKLERIADARKCYQAATRNASALFSNEGYLNLGLLEMKEQNFQSAKEYLQKAATSNLALSINAYFSLAYIAIREEDYDTCYNIIEKLETKDLNFELERSLKKLRLYTDKKVGRPIPKKDYKYTEEQIIDYSENKAIKYIGELHTENDALSVFGDDININTLFYQVKANIKNITPNISSLLDEYILTVPNVGYGPTGAADKIKVLCLPNTDSIITMYPINQSVSKPVEEEVPKVAIKRMSQIEKFNARYGKK